MRRVPKAGFDTEGLAKGPSQSKNSTPTHPTPQMAAAIDGGFRTADMLCRVFLGCWWNFRVVELAASNVSTTVIRYGTAQTEMSAIYTLYAILSQTHRLKNRGVFCETMC